MSASPSYRIELEPERSYMRLTFAGMMTPALLNDYERESTEAYKRMAEKAAQPGAYLMLIDGRTGGVQSKEVTTRYREIFNQYVALTRRLAYLMSTSALEMMQVKRIATKGGAAFFVEEDKALEWLFSD